MSQTDDEVVAILVEAGMFGNGFIGTATVRDTGAGVLEVGFCVPGLGLWQRVETSFGLEFSANRPAIAALAVSMFTRLYQGAIDRLWTRPKFGGTNAAV